MRLVALAALACALGLSLPCAAQSETEQAELPQTSTVAKQSRPAALSRPAAPQLLAPPEESLPAANAPVIPRLAAAADPGAVRPRFARARAGGAARHARRGRSRRRSVWSTGSTTTTPIPHRGACPRRSTPWTSSASSAMRRRGLLHRLHRRRARRQSEIGPALVAKMLPLPTRTRPSSSRPSPIPAAPIGGSYSKYRSRMALRQPLIEYYLTGKRETLMEVELSEGRPSSTRCGAITSPPASTSRSCASWRRCVGRKTRRCTATSP